ncbi:MAG: hypothetical protein AABY34_05075 [Pseudomonadota bacterium]
MIKKFIVLFFTSVALIAISINSAFAKEYFYAVYNNKNSKKSIEFSQGSGTRHDLAPGVHSGPIKLEDEGDIFVELVDRPDSGCHYTLDAITDAFQKKPDFDTVYLKSKVYDGKVSCDASFDQPPHPDDPN